MVKRKKHFLVVAPEGASRISALVRVFGSKALGFIVDSFHGRMYWDVLEMNDICCRLTVSGKALNEFTRERF